MRRKLNARLLLGVLVTLLVLGTGVHWLHGYQMQQNASALRERGDRALANGRVRQGLQLYAQYLQYEPGDLVALHKYAEVLDRHASTAAERARAIHVMEQVVTARPDDKKLRLRLVHNLVLFHRLPEAMENLQALLAHDPKQAELHHMLGWCQDARKQYKDAAHSFRQALAHDPQRLDTYTLLAEMLQERLHQPDEAAKVMDEMVQANPRSYRAYLARAHFHEARQEEEPAAADLAQARQLAPRAAEVLLAAARWAVAHEKRDEAAELLRQGVAAHPEDPALVKMHAELEAAAGRRSVAIAALQTALAKQPQAQDLLVLLADLLIDEGPGQYPAAERTLAQLRKLPGPLALPDYLQARLDFGRGQGAAAIALLERIRGELGPRSQWPGRVHALLGACYRRAGDPEAALAAYRRAVEADPTRTAAQVGLGAALLDSGRLDEALAELQPLRTATDLPADYWALLGRALLFRNLRLPAERRSWSEVEAALSRASGPDGERTEAALLRAEMLTGKGDLAAARAALEQQLPKAPAERQVTLWCALADLAFRQGRETEADQLLQRAETALGDRLEIRLARCRLWSARGSNDDRQKLTRLGEGLESFRLEDRVRLWRDLADAWKRLGDREQAAALWRTIAEAQPRDVRSRFALVELALEARPAEEVRRRITELRDVEGEAGSLWHYGSAALQVREARGSRQNLAAARHELEGLQRRHKQWAQVPLLLGRIDEHEGQPAKAAQHYFQALELGESRAGLIHRLLSLLLERRDFTRAEEALHLYTQRQTLTSDLLRLATEVALGNRDDRLALTRARQAVPLPSRDYRDYLWRARIAERAGELKQAEVHLREAVRIADDMPDVWVALLAHLGATNRAGEAEPLLAEARTKLPPDALALTMARAREALRQPALAKQAYEQALVEHPRDPALLAAAADFHRRAGHAPQAETLLWQLIDSSLDAPAELVVRARRQLAVLLADTHQAEALALLEANQRQLGTSVADERIRLFLRGDRAGFKESRQRQALTVDEMILLARLHEASGRLAPARDELMQAITLDDRSAEALARLVQVLIRTEELGEARTYLQRLQTLEPDSPRVAALREAIARAEAQR